MIKRAPDNDLHLPTFFLIFDNFSKWNEPTGKNEEKTVLAPTKYSGIGKIFSFITKKIFTPFFLTEKRGFFWKLKVQFNLIK